MNTPPEEYYVYKQENTSYKPISQIEPKASYKTMIIFSASPIYTIQTISAQQSI